MSDDALTRATWRKSSFSTAVSGGGECVEVAALDDGRFAIRDSRHPKDGVVLSTRSAMAAFVQGVKAREFDDLA